MTIGNIAFVDWAVGVNYFCLSDYLRDISVQADEISLDAFSYAMSGGHEQQVKNRLNAGMALETDLEKQRMPLRISLDLRHGFWPHMHLVEYREKETCRFHWETSPRERLPESQDKHSLFRIVERLAEETGDIVRVSVIRNQLETWEATLHQHQHNVMVTFYVTEDIRRPTRYLQALAERMADWARPVS